MSSRLEALAAEAREGATYRTMLSLFGEPTSVRKRENGTVVSALFNIRVEQSNCVEYVLVEATFDENEVATATVRDHRGRAVFISRASYEGLEEGMSFSSVQKILGEPESIRALSDGDSIASYSMSAREATTAESSFVEIVFDASGRLKSKTYYTQ